MEIDDSKQYLIDYVFWLEDKYTEFADQKTWLENEYDRLSDEKTELLHALELLLQLEPQDDNVCYEVRVARETVARIKGSTLS